MSVLVIVGATAVAGSWLAAPIVSMARRGTIDDRTTTTSTEALRRAHRREAAVAAIPAPRTGAHDQRRSPVST